MINVKKNRDGHMHSPFCPHGTKDAFELYVNKAIQLGIEEITFTEHMPLPGIFMDKKFLDECAMDISVTDAYLLEVKKVKESYKNIIKINSGFEVDFVEGYEGKTRELLNRFGYGIEDGIISVHFIKIGEQYLAIDVLEQFKEAIKKLGTIEKVYDKYYETLLLAIKADLGNFKPKRIGHPTLIRIFNNKYPCDYEPYELLDKIAKEIKNNNYEVDINTAGLRKPYCKEVYPSGAFLDLVKKYNIATVYGSDAHRSSDVGKDFI